MGCPKGPFLDHSWLFLIFINDLPDATNFYVKLFADDTFLCAQNSNLKLLKHDVNIEINKVYRWLVSNKLTLNILKSKFMIISNKKCINDDFSVCINGSPLEKCDQYKYLGVVIDKNLNWKSHVDYISTKISKACGVLSKLRHFMSSKILVEIYHALVHSYLRYGIITWGNASDTTLKPIQTLINRVIRIITFAPFGRIELEPLYKELQILNLKNTFYLETSKFMFKLENDMLPQRFANHFENEPFTSHKSSYALRCNRGMKRMVTRLVSSKNSIQIRGPDLWKNIPEIFKKCSSLHNFKKLVKCMLIEPEVHSPDLP